MTTISVQLPQPVGILTAFLKEAGFSPEESMAALTEAWSFDHLWDVITNKGRIPNVEKNTISWFWEQALAYYGQNPDALDPSFRNGFSFTFLTLGGVQHLLRIHQGQIWNEETWVIPEQRLGDVKALLPAYWSLIPQETSIEPGHILISVRHQSES